MVRVYILCFAVQDFAGAERAVDRPGPLLVHFSLRSGMGQHVLAGRLLTGR